MQVAPEAALSEGFGAGNTVPASGYMRVGSDKVVQDVANATGEYQTRPGRGGSILEHVRPEATEVGAGKGAFVPDRARTEYNRISDSLRTEADTGARLNMPTGQFDKLDLGDPKRLLATIQARKEAVGRLSSEDRDVVALLEEGKASKALSERYATPHPLSPAAGKKPAEKPATGTGRRDAVGGLLRAAKSMKSSTARTADGAHKMVRQFYQLSASERQAAIAKDGPLADFDALIQRGIGIEESTRTAFNIPEQTDKPLTTKSEALSEVKDTVWGRLKDANSPATTKNMAVGGWNKSGGGENNATTQKDMQRTVDDVLERLGKYGHDPKNILRMLDATFTTPKYREREAEAVLTRSVWKSVKAKYGLPVSPGENTAGAIEREREAAALAKTAGVAGEGVKVPARSAPPITVEGILSGKYDRSPDVDAIRQTVESQVAQVRALPPEQRLALAAKLRQLGVRR